LSPDPDILLTIRASTRCSHSEISGYSDGQLIVRTTAPPVGGKANKDIIRQLATEFRAPPSKITLLRGKTSRIKVFRIRDARFQPAYLAVPGTEDA